MTAGGSEQVVIKAAGRDAVALKMGNRRIPLNSKGHLLIHFRGKGKSFTYIPAAAVLNDSVSRSQLEGRIVFVGATASGLEETIPTPFDNVFPGVEIHATIVDNILQGDFLAQPGWVRGAEFALVVSLGLASVLLLTWARALWGVLFIGLCSALLWLGSEWVFQSEGIFVSPLFALIVLLCNFSFITALKFWREEQKVKERTKELLLTQETTIESIANLVEYRDPETGGHIQRTQHYVRLLAEQLKDHPRFRDYLDDVTIGLLYKSASLHDIGKVGVPDHILLKPGKLTELEWEEMKKHPIYGSLTLRASEKKLGENSFLRLSSEIAYTHQEKWDGSGYPQGLKGEEIPIAGRLMALADVYDALVSRRSYKKPVSHEEAVAIIREGKGKHFDPDVVEAFLAVEDEFLKIGLEFADSEEEREILRSP
jgi:adenylate cyclase